MDKEEDIIKKTFYYRHNTLALACQRLKEVLMKEYNKPFLMICTFIGGIVASIRLEREYSRELKYFKRTTPGEPSGIIYIALHSPLTLYEASEIYPLAQACQVDKYQVAEFAYICEGDVENIKRLLIHKVGI